MGRKLELNLGIFGTTEQADSGLTHSEQRHGNGKDG